MPWKERRGQSRTDTWRTYVVTKHVWLFCDPRDCHPQDSSALEISQAKILEWVTVSSPEDLPDPEIKPTSSALACGFFTPWATWEAPLQETEMDDFPKLIQITLATDSRKITIPSSVDSKETW